MADEVKAAGQTLYAAYVDLENSPMDSSRDAIGETGQSWGISGGYYQLAAGAVHIAITIMSCA